MRRFALLVALVLVPDIACANEISILNQKHAAQNPARFAQPATFHAFGAAGFGFIKKKRDRTVRFVPRQTAGGTVVDVVLDDRATGKVSRGSFTVDDSGALAGASGEMLSATNLVGITPKVLADLDSGKPSVSVPGRIEANGKVYDVTFTHTREGSGVVTHVDNAQAGVALTTRTTVGADSLPTGAKTTGNVGKIWVDLTLERTE